MTLGLQLGEHYGKPINERAAGVPNYINNYDFLLKKLPAHAANKGPKTPAIAPEKPIKIYACQPLVNQFRSNTRFSK